jgi:hypothetical protein
MTTGVILHRDELAKVSYLDTSRLGERTVALLPLWDGLQWRVWIPDKDKLIELHPGNAMQADYVALEKASESDLWFGFLDFLWRRASWPPVLTLIERIRADIHNLGTALAKIDHFFAGRKEIGFGVGAFVQTEIEYLFMLSRSLFDLIHQLIGFVWSKKVILDDSAAEKKRKQRALPESFADVVLEGNSRVRTAADLKEKYAFTALLADAYQEAGPFFANMRTFRDEVAHGGTSPDIIYVTDRGFCVDPTRKPFASFDIWSEASRFNERLSCLRVFLAHLVFTSIDRCSALVDGLARSVTFPPDLAPGYKVFVRGPHNHALATAQAISEGGDPWWDI